MTALGYDGSHRAQRLSFLSTLWLILIVVMLSALAPFGLPLSRTTGSAFSPATTAVAIKARAAAAVETPVRILPLPADPPAAVAPLPGHFLILLLIAVFTIPGVRRVPALHSILSWFGRARAPPSLMV